MKSLISSMLSQSDCKIFSAFEGPCVESQHQLPEDLQTFYKLCGGAILAPDSPYSIRIVRPEEVRLANPVIVGELCPDDISSNWYIICEDIQGNYLTIDLAPSRNGLCYDSFYDRHGIVGSCPIIAPSFTDLLNNLFASKGQYWYWLQREAPKFGDAYEHVLK